MPVLKRFEEKKKETIRRKQFTQFEIEQVKQECNGNSSHDTRLRWLVNRKAIKLVERKLPPTKLNSQPTSYYDVVVICSQDGTFPYVELSALWDAYEFEMNKVEYAKNKKITYLDELSQQLPDKDLQGTLGMI